ncbi:hypothetical protein [Haloarchaeobius salinus]|uniref:hypothetical protein n=1 Tax=Haloarchaeobius salinus TaxID=1198298 RepID=UPI00210BDB2A|nr:hypothetical protein [Haloarchaeobius salinus]
MRPGTPPVLAVVVSALLLTGCLNLPGQATTAEPTTTAPLPPTPQPVSDLSELSESEAGEIALQAEETYLSMHLRNASCLETWGTYPTTSSTVATVVNRSAERIIVTVQHPYSYSTDTSEADSSSTARYRVTENGTTRLSGDEIAPC